MGGILRAVDHFNTRVFKGRTKLEYAAMFGLYIQLFVRLSFGEIMWRHIMVAALRRVHCSAKVFASYSQWSAVAEESVEKRKEKKNESCVLLLL